MSIREVKSEMVSIISDIVDRTIKVEHNWDNFMYEMNLLVDLFCDELKLDVYELYERFPLLQAFFSTSPNLADFTEFIKLLMNLSLFPSTSNYTKLYDFYNNEFYPRLYSLVSDFDELSTYIRNNSDIEPYSSAVLYLNSMKDYIDNIATYLSDISSLLTSLNTAINSFVGYLSSSNSSRGGIGTYSRRSSYRGKSSGYKYKRYSRYSRRG